MNTTPMNAWTPSLVALDIDGTLMDPSGHISGEVHRAIDLARAAGHHLVLATGRSLAGLLPVAARLGLTDGYAVASNGALVIRLDPEAPDGYRYVSAGMFDPASVIRRATRLAPDVCVAVEEPSWGWRVSGPFDPDALPGEHKRTSVTDLSGAHALRVVLCGSGIRRHLDALRTTGMTVTAAGPDWLDVTGVGVSKATALEFLRANLEVPHHATVAVGDGADDVETLIWAARGVAMGQASATVRWVADEVTGTIAENGAATVLASLVSPGH
ncbi:HAD family hydrolase [Promicromonospora sp. NPDC057138]|uniref:HAD family hydrolase n=1 Tax=Promicromonospora sp. NPDC057138 TaxID=3346031 RepID=UPI0036412827